MRFLCTESGELTQAEYVTRDTLSWQRFWRVPMQSEQQTGISTNQNKTKRG